MRKKYFVEALNELQRELIGFINESEFLWKEEIDGIQKDIDNLVDEARFLGFKPVLTSDNRWAL